MQLCNLVRESQYLLYKGIHVHMPNLLTGISYHVVLMCAHVICQEEQFETNKKYLLEFLKVEYVRILLL